MNNGYSGLEGCFWNPKKEKFTCVVSGLDKDYDYYEDEYDDKFGMSECKESCPKVCSENNWKCNDLCIPISQPCNGDCMKYLTFECNDSCIPVNKPCNSLCYDEYNQINCRGKCFDTRYEKEKIIQSGCKGEIQSLIKFSLIEMLKPSCRSSMLGPVNSFNSC
jgi:hypothetical protein